MAKLIAFLFKPPVISLIGVLALALLVYFVGALLPFGKPEPILSGVGARLAVGGVLFGSWALYWIGAALRARARNRSLVADLTSGELDETDRAKAEELAVLRKRFEDAVAALKRSRRGVAFGGRHLYQLPWYLIIGPPGCGKTTVLVNSGLRFALPERFGQDPIKGVSGTRNCDWWFADDAVFLDTAGRWVTQDSSEAVDSAAWQGFLDLLKKHRPRRPINGVMVAVSLSDLMQQDEKERATQAREVHKRLQELHDALKIRFPVYVLLMKADLVAGFMETFGDLGEQGRAQVWGTSFPLEDLEQATAAVDGFGAEFDLLQQRLTDQRLALIQQERDLEKRTLLFRFAQQFGSLRKPLMRFLADVFDTTHWEYRPMVRGVYFTSGTQQGNPIDRVMHSLAANFGLDARQASVAVGGEPRSFFIQRLIREVIYPEAELAGADLRLERRRAWVQRIAYGFVLGLALIAACAWFVSYQNNRSYVSDVDREVRSIQEQLRELPLVDRDLDSLLPLLDGVRRLPGGFAQRGRDPGLMHRLGLYQGEKLGQEASDVYRTLLNRALLPLLLDDLEHDIRDALGDPGRLHALLRIYLMFDHCADHYDSATVRSWAVGHWTASLYRKPTKEHVTNMEDHVQALLEECPALPSPLERELIRRAQQVLVAAPVAEQVYARLLEEGIPADIDIEDFVLSRDAGYLARDVFKRTRASAFDDKKSRLYTHRGYHLVVEPRLDEILSEIKDESWVLGPDAPLGAGDEMDGIRAQVRTRYYQDYQARWHALLQDIELKRPTTAKQAADTLLKLADTRASPLRGLLAAVAEQTRLDRPVTDGQDQTVEDGEITDDATAAAEDAGIPEAQVVSDAFRHIHELIEAADRGGVVPVDQLLDELTKLAYFMEDIGHKIARGGEFVEIAIEGNDPRTSLARTLNDIPDPVKRWIETFAHDCSNLIAGGRRRVLNDIWIGEGLRDCKDLVAGRYPLQTGSRRAATMSDFGKVFGPNGSLSGFVASQLQSSIDTRSDPWRWRDTALGIPDEALVQFQRAQEIGQAFFPSGDTPSTEFELKPRAMPGLRLFQLNLEGQKLTYQNEAPQWSRFQWPGPEAAQGVRIRMVGQDGSVVIISEDDPWAWFRLWDRYGHQKSDSKTGFAVSFGSGGLRATLDLRAASARNPFDVMSTMRRFRCPSRI